jgi:kynurenine formamidase
MIFQGSSYIDLTHTITPTIPTWDGSCGFKLQILLDYNDCTTEVKFHVQRFEMVAGIGTHMDAPAHCIAGANTIDKLQLTSLCVPCVVIDVRTQADAYYTVSWQDLENFENRYGIIPAGSLVAINTGWDRFWHDADAYRNNHKFPSISPEVARWLVNRKIVGIAIDTLGVDRPEDGYPVHPILLGAGIYIIENATNLDKLPPVGAFTIALPIKVANSTEAPIRFVGIIP